MTGYTLFVGRIDEVTQGFDTSTPSTMCLQKQKVLILEFDEYRKTYKKQKRIYSSFSGYVSNQIKLIKMFQ